MPKKIISLVLIFTLVFSLSGCTNIFQKEHLYVTEYTDNPNGSGNKAISIPNYAKLKRSVKQMVTDHSTEAKFIFSGYDSDLQSDLSQLGREVKSEYALAGFCVDYISYDPNRIVTYYEAIIHITYKHTSEEISEIVPVAGLTGFRDEISQALADCKTKLVVQWVIRNLTETDVIAEIMDVYYSDPTACVVPPNPIVNVNNSSIFRNIVEIEMCYGYTDDKLETMKSELEQKIIKLSNPLPIGNITDFSREAYSCILHVCEYDKDGSMRSNNPKLADSLGSTAYGALIEGYADSLGIALAFSALCSASGVKCSVVGGSYNQNEHWWNIVTTNDKCYHVDVAGYNSVGFDASFLKSDTQMQANGYCWEKSIYPECIKVAEN